MVLLLCASDAWGQDLLTEKQQEDLVLWKAAVIQSPGGPETRETAVKRLYESGWPEAYAFLDECLQHPEETNILEVVCEAIRKNGIPPYQLRDSLLDALAAADVVTIPTLVETLVSYPVGDVLPRLIALIGQSDRPIDEQVAIVHAMSQFVEVETVDALIDRLNVEQREPIRQAVLEALKAITGAANNGDSATVWNLWWEQNRSRGREWLLENALRREKVRASELRRNSEALDQELGGLLDELITAHERVYWLTKVDDRPALLQLYLNLNSRIEVRLLGFQLVEKAISNAESIQPETVAVVIEQADDSNRLIRLAAYRLLGLLDGERAVELAVNAFPQERNSEVRQIMISLMEQYPTTVVISLLIPSLDVPTEKDVAVAAMVSTCRAVAVETAIVNEAVGRILSNHGDVTQSTFNPNEIELFAWSTNETTQGIVRGVLEDTQAESGLVAAAAQGLAQSAHLQDTLTSASARSEVYPWVVELVTKQGGIESLKTILNLPAPNEDVYRQAVIGMMTSLPPTNWLEADDLVAGVDVFSLTDRIEHLSGVLAINGETNGGSHMAESLDGLTRRALCLRLAELHLLDNQPTATLTALEAAPAAETDQDQFNHLRAIAHIALGQLDQTELIEVADAADWIEAIKISMNVEPVDFSVTRHLIEGVRQRFGDPLADAKHEETLVALIQQLSELSSVDAEPTTEEPVVNKSNNEPSDEESVKTENEGSGEDGGGGEDGEGIEETDENGSDPETDSPDKSEEDK